MKAMSLSEKTQTWCDGWQAACKEIQNYIIDAIQRDEKASDILRKIGEIEKAALNEAPTLPVWKHRSESESLEPPAHGDPRSETE
jgi:hypothetical protein